MHKLSNIKAGDLLKTKYGYYTRALSDVQYSHLGELATVYVSYGDTDKNSNDLKECSTTCTLYELETNGFEIVQEERTLDDILNDLSDKDKEIIKQKLK